LQFLRLSVAGKAILINGETSYAIKFPLSNTILFPKFKTKEGIEEMRQLFAEHIVLACHKFNIKYESKEYVTTLLSNILPEIIEAIKQQEKEQRQQQKERQRSTVSITKSNSESKSRQLLQQQNGTVMKYTISKDITHDKEETPPQLWETVKVGGQFYFVSYDSIEGKLRWTNEINEENRTLKPYMENATESYSFRDQSELENCIKMARSQTLGTLFKMVGLCVSSFYDTDNDAYTNLVAADILFTYFQDRIGKTHYVFVYGEPGTGKGVILECFNQLAYRGVQVTDASAASIYRVLGNVEKGQVVLIIDEANRLEDNPFLLEVLKVGYKGENKVPRVMDASSGENSKVVYYYAYCFKVIAAEKLPVTWKTGGFLSRCLTIQTSPGDPTHDIQDVVDNAGDSENTSIMRELAKLRKLLFAYRLLHYSEPIPDVQIKGIIGRDRELIKPLIRLFKTHGDTQSLDTIKKTLHYFIKQRNQEKTDSFEASIHTFINYLLQYKHENEQQQGLAFSEIWNYAKEQLKGEPVDEKPDTIQTSLFGEVSKKRLAYVLKSLGGKRDRDSTGDKRTWKFDTKILGRFTKAYKQIPETIEIVEQETLESAGHRSAVLSLFSDDDDEKSEYEKEEFQISSDRSDRSDTSSEDSVEAVPHSLSEARIEIASKVEEITGNSHGSKDNLGTRESSGGSVNL
jgi:hypothetical protein